LRKNSQNRQPSSFPPGFPKFGLTGVCVKFEEYHMRIFVMLGLFGSIAMALAGVWNALSVVREGKDAAVALESFRNAEYAARQAFLGADLEVFVNPDEVVAYKIEPDWPNYPQQPVVHQYSTSPKLVGRFPVISGNFVEDLSTRQRLIDRLAAKSAFDNRKSDCEQMQPTLAYEFVKGERKLYFALCFKCRRMQVIKSNGELFSQSFGAVDDDLKFLAKTTVGVLAH
jgi:hypothetical protein